MGHLPISSHIAVISHSGGKKLPEANANALPGGEAGGKFADVLASQVSPQGIKDLVAQVAAEGAQAAKAADVPVLEIATQAAGEQAAQPLSDVLSAIPLSQLPLAQAVEQALTTSGTSKADVRVAVEAAVTRDADPLTTLPLNAQASLLAETKPDVLRAVAAKAEQEPAIIAGLDKQLPIKRGVELEAVDLKQNPLVSAHLPAAPRAESSAASAPAPAPVSLPVEVKVGAPGWDNVFSQRVAWAATNQHQVAELRLNPPNLGPVEVRITITNDQATASFVSSHASVRESIEAALPKLREMLGESGLTLGNVNVSSQSFQQQQQQQAGQGENKSHNPHGGFMAEPALDLPLAAHKVTSIAVGRNGLVDVFA